jgi:hypothetical protein
MDKLDKYRDGELVFTERWLAMPIDACGGQTSRFADSLIAWCTAWIFQIQ